MVALGWVTGHLPTVRPAVWITALAIELLTPWLGRRWLRRHPVHSTHLPERLGQFTIILLGATLTNLRDAAPTAHPPARVVAAALCGLPSAGQHLVDLHHLREQQADQLD
ncbi:low temperature requirement protein A [Micromonospora sp. NPDC047738]|uniref:low temperature requirement protein A n=1 Tax=Micromonospora sp. NPDC047738 TaxID=3155741 RepID=UPI0033F269C3